MWKYYLQKQRPRKVLQSRVTSREDDMSTKDVSSLQGLTIDWESADRITVTCLLDHLDSVKKHNERISLQTAEKPSKHLQEDFVYNLRLIEALTVVLSYYGHEV